VVKWTFDGTTWTQGLTFFASAAGGFAYIAVAKVGKNVHIVAITGADQSSPRAQIQRIVDDGTYVPYVTFPPTATLASAPSGTFFSGVALSPR
jgi:hypothetical protein